MSILITGSSGLLGSNLCHDLLQEGKTVVGYDLVHRVPRFMKQHENDKNFVFVKGDITDPWHLMECVKKHEVTEMIHVSALLEDKASIHRPYQFLRTNIIGGVNVLEAARLSEIRRLVIISSRAAYGSYAPSEGPLKEDSPSRPTGFYGASKASIDLILPLYRSHYGLDAVSIRTTGIFGPGQGEEGMGHTGMTAPIYRILDDVLKGNPFVLASGGDHHLEFCYVKDLSKWIKVILEKDRLEHPIYNLSQGKLFGIREIGDWIRELLPRSDITIGPGLLDGSELRAALDIRRARDEFGYEPSPLKRSIEDFIPYMKAVSSGSPFP